MPPPPPPILKILDSPLITSHTYLILVMFCPRAKKYLPTPMNRRNQNLQSTLPRTLTVNFFSSGAPRIHILSQFCLLSGLPTAVVVPVHLTSKASSKVKCTKRRYLPMGQCDRNHIIRWTNRARCTLNKEILNLLNEVSVSGIRSGRASQ